MNPASLECRRFNDFVVIKIRGILKISNLYCLVLLARRYFEQSVRTIVVDVSDELTISNEVRLLQSKPLGFPANSMIIAITGRKDNSKELSDILSRHID